MSRISDLFGDLTPDQQGSGEAPAAAGNGLRCPRCGSTETQVKDSRPAEGNAAIRRRRECLACGERFTTFERAQAKPLTVVKNDGRRQGFDREKLDRSLRLALRKRPVDVAAIDQAAEDIVRRLENQVGNEVSARQIGELVMRALARLDLVALVRYASVYDEFQDLGQFTGFIEEVQAAVARQAEREEQCEDAPHR